MDDNVLIISFGIGIPIFIFVVWNFLTFVVIPKDNVQFLNSLFAFFFGAIVNFRNDIWLVLYGFLFLFSWPFSIQPQEHSPHSHVPALINTIYLCILCCFFLKSKIENIWKILFQVVITFWLPLIGFSCGIFYLYSYFPTDELVFVSWEIPKKATNPSFTKTFFHMSIFTTIILISIIPVLMYNKLYKVLAKLALLPCLIAGWLTIVFMLPVWRMRGYSRIRLEIPQCVELTKTYYCYEYYTIRNVNVNNTEINCCSNGDVWLEMHMVVQVIAMYVVLLLVLLPGVFFVLESECKTKRRKEKDNLTIPLLDEKHV